MTLHPRLCSSVRSRTFRQVHVLLPEDLDQEIDRRDRHLGFSSREPDPVPQREAGYSNPSLGFGSWWLQKLCHLS